MTERKNSGEVAAPARWEVAGGLGNRRRSSTAGGGALERLGRGDGEAPRDLLYSILDRKMRMVAPWLRAGRRRGDGENGTRRGGAFL